ncbi:MAG: hypothetical protein ACLTZU_09745 [Odoribacter splanchnicus]
MKRELKSYLAGWLACTWQRCACRSCWRDVPVTVRHLACGRRNHLRHPAHVGGRSRRYAHRRYGG